MILGDSEQKAYWALKRFLITKCITWGTNDDKATDAAFSNVVAWARTPFDSLYPKACVV